MQEFLTTFFFPALIGVFTAGVTWFLARRKNTAEAKSAEIDNEIKSATYYQNLLDDMSKRLEASISEIEKRDRRIEERDLRIEERDVHIKERDRKIDLLIAQVEHLTDELKKYKQLNGKV